MEKAGKIKKISNWLFVLIFIVVGILNLIFIHPVPGLFYLIVSLIYLPPVYEYAGKKMKFSIPFVVRVIIFLLIMWATLAVGDLMEMFESWLINGQSME